MLSLRCNSLTGPLPSALGNLGNNITPVYFNADIGGVGGIGAYIPGFSLDLNLNRLSGLLPAALFRGWGRYISALALANNNFSGRCVSSHFTLLHRHPLAARLS